MTRRIVSIFVTLLMVLAILPMSALARSEAPAVIDDELDYALNAAGGDLSFENNEDYPWVVLTDDETGRVYAQSGNAGQSSTSSVLTLNTDVAVNQAIHFDFKAWGEGTSSPFDKCIFAIDGTAKFTYGKLDNDWTEYSCNVTPGSHVFTWTYSKDYSVNPEGDYFAVDNVRFEAREELPVNEELDAALNVEGGEIHFHSNGDYPWIVVEDDTTERIYAKSGNSNINSSESVLTATINTNEGDVLSFEFKAWGEGTSTFWDHCDFYLDGVRELFYGAYNNENWETVTFDLSEGEHELRWSFTKDSSDNGTGDFFAVDNVEITAGEEPAVTDEPVVTDEPIETDDPYLITEIDVDGFIQPVDGMTGEEFVENLTVPEGANYSYEGCMVYEGENMIYSDDILAAGNTYLVAAMVVADQDYSFSEDAVLTANGGEMEISDESYVESRSAAWIVVELLCEEEPVVTDEPNLIDTIEINDFVVPAYGENPFFNVTVPEEAGYEIMETAWEYYNNSEEFGELTADDAFDRFDVAYYQSFKIVPLEGYDFADEVTVLINGSDEYVYEDTTKLEEGYYQVETIDFVIRDPELLDNLDAALNAPGGELHFDTDDLDFSGNIEVYPWFTVDEGEGGRYYAKSGNGGVDESESAIWTLFDSVEGDVFAFDFKAWGEGSGWDVCEFWFDEHKIFSFGALDNDWTTYVLPLEAGNHMAAWIYKKDDSVHALGDYFAVDNVYVGEPIYPESIEADDVEVMVNHNVQIDWTVLPEDSLWKNVTFESADEDIAIVDRNGVVHGVSEGVTEVTIRINYGLEEPEPQPYPTGWVTKSETEPEYPDVYTTITVTVIPVKDLVIGYYFETQPEEDGWQFVDADGDDYNWHWNWDDDYFGYVTAEWAYEGEGFIMSDSCYAPYSSELPEPSKSNASTRYVELDPDNWAISPAIELPTGSAWVTFFASSFLYPELYENLEVYVGLTDDITEMENVMEATKVTAVTVTYYEEPVNYMQFDVDLSDYLGETVYIAIRHFIPEEEEFSNCFLAVDMFEIFGTDGLIIVDEVHVDGYEFPPLAGYESMNHLDLTVPEDAPYFVDFEWTNWYDEDDQWDFFDRFIGGTNYSVYTTIQLPEGYEFADEVTIYVNGETELVSAYVYNYGDHLVFYTVPFLCHMWGDADGDGELTTTDTLLIMRYSLGLVELDEELIDPWCDVNDDGEWNFTDALLILRKVMNVIDFFPVEAE